MMRIHYTPELILFTCFYAYSAANVVAMVEIRFSAICQQEYDRTTKLYLMRQGSMVRG